MNEDSSTLDQVVYDGVKFLQSLTTHYGSERGMEIWEALGEVMGKQVKGRVFFALMTGETSGRVRFRVHTSPGSYNPNKVSCIKEIRVAADIGLKEAKDLFESSMNKTVHVDCLTPEHGRVLAKKLRDLGCVIS